MKKRISAAVVLLCIGWAGASAQEVALKSIGALGAGYMYTAYLSIGAIADGHYYEVYDDETAIQIMEEIKNLADGTTDSLQELLGSDTLSVEDFNYINEIISVFGLLYKEAESYQGFVQTGEQKQANLYDNYRNNAWSKITVLLGIEE